MMRAKISEVCDDDYRGFHIRLEFDENQNVRLLSSGEWQAIVDFVRRIDREALGQPFNVPTSDRDPVLTVDGPITNKGIEAEIRRLTESVDRLCDKIMMFIKADGYRCKDCGNYLPIEFDRGKCPRFENLYISPFSLICEQFTGRSR